jgi:hypothetical protein
MSVKNGLKIDIPADKERRRVPIPVQSIHISTGETTSLYSYSS